MKKIEEKNKKERKEELEEKKKRFKKISNKRFTQTFKIYV